MSQLKKLQGEVKFNPSTFNNRFLAADVLAKQEKEQEEQQDPNQMKILNNVDIDGDVPLVMTDDLGIDMKNLFFKILELLADSRNPIPYIMDSSRRQFVFAVMIICIGGLLMFFSNLMISS